MPQWQLDLLGVGLSLVGGGLASMGISQATLKIKQLQDMPALAPTGSFLIGSILVFVLPNAAKPLGHGIVGVSGGAASDMALNGLSRIEIQGDEINAREEDAQDEVDNLSRINAAIQEAAENAEEINYKMMADADGTGE